MGEAMSTGSEIDWRRRILDYGAALGRATYEHALGVGVEFEDGCDVFWVLPGEVMSTVPVPPGGPASVEELLAEYDAISRVRERALHVIRHYVASRDIRLERSPSGEWAWETSGGMSSTLAVGAGLTAVARETRDVCSVVAARLKDAWLGKVPSRKRIERYLNTVGAPANERGPGEEPRTVDLVPQTIRGALGMLGVCRALENPQKALAPGGAEAAAGFTGRIGQMLLHLADRLPNVKASVDLLKPGAMSLEFEDGANSFDIDTRSKSLARRIRADGPVAVGDQLADEYLGLNAARSRVLRAVWGAAARRGWRKQTIGAIFGIERATYLGRTNREVAFDDGVRLTAALRNAAPDAVLRELFKAYPDFAEECVAALSEPALNEPVGLPEAELAPRDVPPALPLRALDDEVIAEMDGFAADALSGFLRGERTIWEYRNRALFDPAIDAWATLADWVDVARPLAANGEWPHPMAVLILLDANDPGADGAARRLLAKAEPHHEASDAEVEIVWRYRHALPDVARRWFAPSLGEDVPFARVRAGLGDPVATRKIGAAQGDEPDLNDAAAAVTRFPRERQEQVHRELLAWARADWHCSPPNESKLRVALAMGWRDVADALESNPFLLGGLLTCERRSDQFDEPGMLLAKDFLLAWSRLSPSRFLARLLATGRATDLVALAQDAARASAVGKPDVEKFLPISIEGYHHWLKDLEPAMAIAWTRCRRAGVVAQ